MSDRETEHVRREYASRAKGQVEEGTGSSVAPKVFEHVVSLRLEDGVLRELRKLSQERGLSLSALIRGALDELILRGIPTTRFEWQVTTAEGTSPVRMYQWPETPASHSALRDANDEILAT